MEPVAIQGPGNYPGTFQVRYGRRGAMPTKCRGKRNPLFPSSGEGLCYTRSVIPVRHFYSLMMSKWAADTRSCWKLQWCSGVLCTKWIKETHNGEVCPDVLFTSPIWFRWNFILWHTQNLVKFLVRMGHVQTLLYLQLKQIFFLFIRTVILTQ